MVVNKRVSVFFISLLIWDVLLCLYWTCFAKTYLSSFDVNIFGFMVFIAIYQLWLIAIFMWAYGAIFINNQWLATRFSVPDIVVLKILYILLCNLLLLFIFFWGSTIKEIAQLYSIYLLSSFSDWLFYEFVFKQPKNN